MERTNNNVESTSAGSNTLTEIFKTRLRCYRCFLGDRPEQNTAEVYTVCWSGFLNGNGFNSLVRLWPVTQVNWQQMRLLSGNRREWESCTEIRFALCVKSSEASRREILRATQQRREEDVSNVSFHFYLPKLKPVIVLFIGLIFCFNRLWFRFRFNMTFRTGMNRFGRMAAVLGWN